MPDDPNTDPFRPPEIPTEVGCLHCQQVYESYLIEWRVSTKADGTEQGFWCCPTPDCGGAGFGCDIFPTDPDYQDENLRSVGFDAEDEDEKYDEFEDDEFEEELEDLPDDLGPASDTNGPTKKPRPDDDMDIPW